ncbi:uncharacterized protein LOC131309618 [Rhododendron vialii]|uniref:uncharacterized protein LOC131309618 n=1 Tax=Rhododendron vialii TaxID=182163 RepID=UPI00265F41BB|nr:uncharacterized protein LOC131309618 [Rhododendron vialii]
MKLLSWNCQGLGHPLTVRAARSLACGNGINLLFLMETKCTVYSLRSLVFKLGDGNKFAFFAPQDGGRYLWGLVFAVIYGHPVLSRREDTWVFLGEVASKLSGPLLVMGDFNQVLNDDEKWSTNTGQIRGWNWCSNFVTRCGLSDIPSFGVKFTWSNNQSGDAATYEKLDRAMAYQRIQRFEEAWVGIDAVHQIAKKVWNVPLNGSFAFKIMQKQKMLLRHLANWKKLSIGYLTEEIESRKRQLEKIQFQLGGQQWGLETEVIVKQDLLVRRELEDLLAREEAYWAQRAKQNWLAMGDRNIKYFHKMASIRAQKNRIVALKDSTGVLVTDPDAIEAMFLDHFRSLFRCEAGSSMSKHGYADYVNGVRDETRVSPSLLTTIKTKLTGAQQQDLDQPITPDEIRKAMFQMDGRKVPGPDGFVAAFYQENWDWLGTDVVQASLAFFESGFMLKELNQTLITLIPKVPNPQSVSDFRPISLCNVLYKVLTKVLVNRLRLGLGDLISQYQNGFVPTRMILDNVLIAHEMLEFIRKRKRGKRAMYALKLDMNKAYDRVDWNFLLGVLRTMGFSQKWVGWIHQSCGLQQGDPLSPYLFILVAQAFSDGLEEFASHDICRGISVSSCSPRVSHLMFADDCYIFMEHNVDHAWCLKWILDVYCDQAGQKINFNKSELVTSPYMKSQEVAYLKHIFGVKCVDRPGVYLGANMDFSIQKGSLFSKILERIAAKLTPAYFLNKVKSVVSRFLWHGESGKGIVWRRWEVCCLPKAKGGLGLRDLGCLNQALLAKLAWRLLKNPNSLLSKVLVGLKWRIGNGKRISVFRDEWIPKMVNPLKGSPLSGGLPDFKVSDLFDSSCGVWREPLLEVLFPKVVVEIIRSIYFPIQEVEDELIWEHTKNGVFSVKSAYLFRFQIQFSETFRHEQGRFQGWGKIWALGLPPKFLLFVWIVIHRILAVNDALLRRNITVDLLCPLCGQDVETIEHLFLQYSCAMRVWRASHLGFDFSKGSPVGLMNGLVIGSKKLPTRSLMIVCRSSQRNSVVRCRNVSEGGWVTFVTDGAWLAESHKGAAAWVLESSDEDSPYQCEQCRALSASFVEIRVGLMVLHWALGQKMDSICIKTDCAVFVQGLVDRQSAPYDVQAVLSDFCSLCSKFSAVKVVKISRLDVKAAHVKARAALMRL